ncbi:SDR family oxidoreductase [Noviherbaspirillum aerium]|uniref:SDR family oxidoreductase n=1 Tax=Noviherbaspirillum aerium TaxID=2588497 RepID=UPI00178C7F6F|nr:sugar nucleotide-binding protein [Noviherbaspirillum aerium]
MQVLIIGSGFVGRCLAVRLASEGHDATLASRHRPAGLAPELAWLGLDAADRDAFAAVLHRLRPDAIVLVHGPSDISLCEYSPDEAMCSHAVIARNACRLAPHAYKLLVSTDNVFDGRQESYAEDAPPLPANAYGRAKLAAEQVLSQCSGDFLIARTSLVYGWEEADRGWINFFALALRRLAAGDILEVPDALWNTPIFVEDAAAIYTRCIEQSVMGILHVAGPQRISRLDWARLLADEYELDASLIRPIAADASRYFCRPRNSCLSSHHLPALLSAWPNVQCRSPAQAAVHMKPLLHGHLPINKE